MRRTRLWFTVFIGGLILAFRSAGADADISSSFKADGDSAGDIHDLLFDDQWKFFKGDNPKASEPAFDDSTWRTVELPHDWSVEGTFDPKLASCTAFLPCGIGWYRKSFDLPADITDKTIRLRFDGVMNHSTVWCNGRQVGGRPYGYSSFTCDLTSSIKPGPGNVIAVRVDHEQYADSRWYAGSGIYRNVFLTITDKLHVDTDGTFASTLHVTGDSADVFVKTTVKNDDAHSADAMVVMEITDSHGSVVATRSVAKPLQADGQAQFGVIFTIPHPQLWSPDHPAMYSVRTQVKRNGLTVDEYRTPFGIRTFKFDADKGFSINGQSVKLKGVCLHHDAGALGAAVPIQVWERRLKLLKEAGCNAIRCSHNPPAPEFLDLCDRMGFLVMDEAFDEWTQGKHKWIVGHNVGQAGTDGYHEDFEKWADIDLRDMVLRDRNHPSIILWSIGNEIDYTNDPYPPNSHELPPIAARLIADVKAVDTSRPVTAACAFPATNLYKTLLDVEGYNYMEDLYAGDHKANPSRVIYGSENSQSLAAWQAVVQNDFIAGQFLWTGIDYLGEAGVWPSHASGAGLLDLAGFPKNQYYFRKSLWTDAPMVYLSTTGLGKGPRATTAPVEHGIFCFTNCDRVELFHDGKSLGSKPHAMGEIINWPIEFNSGALKAIGKKGNATVTYELKKAGAPVKLLLIPDVTSLVADGRDMAQIEVNVVDAAGNLVTDAENRVTCTVQGPGRIMGIENGDTNCTEDYKSLSHSVHHGRMMVYLQKLKYSGKIKLSVSGPALESATIGLD